MIEYKKFETQRLLIKPSSIEDAEFFLELFNSPKWIKYIGERNVKSIEEAEKYITTRMQPQLEKLGYSNYTIIRKEDNKKIGCCGLYDREGLDGLDIGYALLSEYEGNGYAYEASSKIIEVALNEFGIKKISAITSKNNLASQKLLEKLGLKLSGAITLPGEKEELLLFKTT